jgi:hypothetical protein
MKIIKYENYNTTPLPSEFIRVHCDGINYFFAENESDVAEIEASLPVAIIEEAVIEKVDLSNIDILSLTDEQLLQLKERLNNLK